MITPLCPVKSPNRAAGFPPIITVAEPFTIVSGGPTQIHKSPTTAAGKPPISTVGTQGPDTGPPTCGFGPGSTIGQVCMSEIRAAGGIFLVLKIKALLKTQFLINVYQGTSNARDPCGRQCRSCATHTQGSCSTHCHRYTAN